MYLSMYCIPMIDLCFPTFSLLLQPLPTFLTFSTTFLFRIPTFELVFPSVPCCTGAIIFWNLTVLRDWALTGLNTPSHRDIAEITKR